MATQTRQETRTDTALEPARPWRVVVLNDPVNTMQYVVLVFRRVLGLDRQSAETKMLEVHELGRSIVWTGAREQAECRVHALHGWGLRAVLEPDSGGRS